MRPLLPEDVPLLAEIFRASVEETCAEDYSDAQIEAWVDGGRRRSGFRQDARRTAHADRDDGRRARRLSPR